MSFCISLNLPIYVLSSKTWRLVEVQFISTTNGFLQCHPESCASCI